MRMVLVPPILKSGLGIGLKLGSSKSVQSYAECGVEKILWDFGVVCLNAPLFKAPTE